MGDDAIVVSIFMALEGVHAYSAFLPSVFTIRTFVKTPYGRKMIREGELCASVFLALLALTTCKITKSIMPAIFAGIAGGAMVGVYEYALYKAPVNTGQDTDADFKQPSHDDAPPPRSHDDTYSGLYRIDR